MTAVSKRSLTIWVLVALAIFDGIANLFIAAQFMGWLPIFDPAHLTFFVNDAPWLAALLYAAFGVFWFVVAKWLYDLDRRGWSWVITTASFNLVLALLGSGSWANVTVLVIVNAIELILVLLPSTRAKFPKPKDAT